MPSALLCYCSIRVQFKRDVVRGDWQELHMKPGQFGKSAQLHSTGHKMHANNREIQTQTKMWAKQVRNKEAFQQHKCWQQLLA